MGNFYSEMKEFLESISKSEVGQSSNSNSYFPNIYADTLVLLNPYRWASFSADNAMASNMSDPVDKIKTPLENLLVAKEYFETS